MVGGVFMGWIGGLLGRDSVVPVRLRGKEKISGGLWGPWGLSRDPKGLGGRGDRS